MSIRRDDLAVRCLAAALAALIAVACGGDKESKPDPGGGGEKQPPSGNAGSATITTAGGAVDIAGAKLEIPAGALDADKTITLKPVAATLPSLPDMPASLADHIKPIAAFEAGPDGLALARPGVMTMTIDPSTLPKGKTVADLRAVVVSKDGTIEDLAILAANGNDLQVEVKHFSLLLVLVAMGAIVFTGTMAMMMRGVSEPILRRDCAKWLEPDHPEVAAIAADPNRFAIDSASGAIKLDIGKPLQGMDVDQGAHTLRVGKVLERGKGDCVNMTTLYGSLLLARGYPVRMVAGTATYKRGNKTYKGFHQWAETVIDGKAYYVDTFEPAKTRLIPVDDATTELSLERNRMCGKNPDGSTHGPARYTNWYAGDLDDDQALRDELARLKARHRTLHEDCTGGDNAACNERKQVYDKAKAIQDKLNK